MTAGDPEGQMTAGDPEGQMTAGDPEGQMTAGDPEGQMTAGDPEGQLTVGEIKQRSHTQLVAHTFPLSYLSKLVNETDGSPPMCGVL